MFVAQAILGEVQYRNALPWGLVLVHVVLAATIWALQPRARLHALAAAPAADPLVGAEACLARERPKGRPYTSRVPRELRIYERPATLERPVLIGAFRGWNDGGQAATLAAGYLARLWGARKFADIDPELFVDFQATRPMVSLEEGRTRKIEWPENTFFRARIPEVEPRRDPARRGRAELPVADVQRARHRARAATSASSSP